MELCLQGDFQTLNFEQLECVNGGGSNFIDGLIAVGVGVVVVATSIAVVATAPVSGLGIALFAVAYTAGNALIAAGGASAISGAYNRN